jgi:hypothetical protein
MHETSPAGKRSPPALSECVLNQLYLLLLGRALEVIHRQEHLPQRFETPQHLICHNLDIAPNLSHQLNQSQSIQRTQRVICDDYHTTACGDIAPVSVRNRIADREMFEHLLDKGKAIEMAIFLKKTIDLTFMKQQADQTDQGPRDKSQRCVVKAGISVSENPFDV